MISKIKSQTAFLLKNKDKRKKRIRKKIKMNKYDIFISYNWELQDKVKELYEKLKEVGFHVWMDISKMQGGNLHNEIVDGLRNSDVFICCISEKYPESKNCENEISYAYDLKKKFIVLMFDDLKPDQLGGIGFKIASLLRICLYKNDDYLANGWNSSAFDDIVKQVHKHLQNDSDNNSPNLSRSPSPIPY
jgi:hypothetical protein